MTEGDFDDPGVAAVYQAYPPRVRDALLGLRRIILETAAATKDAGQLIETLKWGQPSYLTVSPKSGSTVRVGPVAGATDQYALYFHCRTNLIETFRGLYHDELTFAGNRAIVFHADDTVPQEPVRHCVSLALTYHVRKRNSRAQAQ